MRESCLLLNFSSLFNHYKGNYSDKEVMTNMEVNLVRGEINL